MISAVTGFQPGLPCQASTPSQEAGREADHKEADYPQTAVTPSYQWASFAWQVRLWLPQQPAEHQELHSAGRNLPDQFLLDFPVF